MTTKNRIDSTLDTIRTKGGKALVAFATAGFPTLSYTEKLVTALEASGVDMVELGIPFSDPIADGPVIDEASHQSLSQGTGIADIFQLARRLRRHTSIPIVAMGYYNPILAFGQEAFVAEAKEAGIDGLIVVDLPPEEAELLIASARCCDFATIFLVTPVSSRDRIETIARASSGFIYCVSYTGITGQKTGSDEHLRSLVETIRAATTTPILVGFGISTPEDVARVCSFADGAVVGSAILREITASFGEGQEESIRRVGQLAARLRQGAGGAR
jgi:tryptophan synthase alpha chain